MDRIEERKVVSDEDCLWFLQSVTERDIGLDSVTFDSPLEDLRKQFLEGVPILFTLCFTGKDGNSMLKCFYILTFNIVVENTSSPPYRIPFCLVDSSSVFFTQKLLWGLGTQYSLLKDPMNPVNINL